MVYSSKNGDPSKYWPGQMLINFVNLTAVAGHYTRCQPGRIECMRCSLLRPDHTAWHISVVHLHCAKTAEWIEVLFSVQTLGTQGTYGSRDPLGDHKVERKCRKILTLIKYENITLVQCGLCQITLVSFFDADAIILKSWSILRSPLVITDHPAYRKRSFQVKTFKSCSLNIMHRRCWTYYNATSCVIKVISWKISSLTVLLY